MGLFLSTRSTLSILPLFLHHHGSRGRREIFLRVVGQQLSQTRPFFNLFQLAGKILHLSYQDGFFSSQQGWSEHRGRKRMRSQAERWRGACDASAYTRFWDAGRMRAKRYRGHT